MNNPIMPAILNTTVDASSYDHFDSIPEVEDFATLNKGEALGDDIIDAYAYLVNKRSAECRYGHCYVSKSHLLGYSKR